MANQGVGRLPPWLVVLRATAPLTGSERSVHAPGVGCRHRLDVPQGSRRRLLVDHLPFLDQRIDAGADAHTHSQSTLAQPNGRHNEGVP